jgi:DNA polymerase I-like protein with 3'-5' exonuclease and polymerase domains
MKLYGLDIETHDPNLMERGEGWIFSDGEILVTGVYDHSTGKKYAYDGNGKAKVKSLLLDPNATIVGLRISYDLGWLCYEHGLRAKDIKANIVDVNIAEQTIDEYQMADLDTLAWKYLRERKAAEPLKAWALSNGLKGDFRKHLKVAMYGQKAEGKLPYIKAVPDLVRAYVISDADQPVKIWLKQIDEINKLGTMRGTNMNMRLIKITLGMKQRGIRIDMPKRKENYETLSVVQKELRDAFVSQYGDVNFNSPKQLAELFDREGIPYRCKIRVKGVVGRQPFVGEEIGDARNKLNKIINGFRVQKGQLVLYVPKQYAYRTNSQLMGYNLVTTCNPSIDKKALEKLRATYPVVKDIMELKQVTSIIDKFLGHGFDRFIVKHGENNYRVHATPNIVGARQTGRLSYTMPNLQQIPSKTVLFKKTDKEIKLYKMCRELIIPDEGYALGKADYSGQENRVMAHFAFGRGADEIRRRYREDPDLDFHMYIAQVSNLLVTYGADVGRKYAKNCSFGLGYGMGIETMMETFGWSREEAERITELYHEGAPFVRDTMDKVAEVILERGYIRTIAGRHCHLRKFPRKCADGVTRYVVNKNLSYTAFNKLIQGSAADMTKLAMIKLDDLGLTDQYPLLLQVHDELLFQIPIEKGAFADVAKIQHAMETPFVDENGVDEFSVPIRADPEVGIDWAHVKGRKKSEETGRFIESTEAMLKRAEKIFLGRKHAV